MSLAIIIFVAAIMVAATLITLSRVVNLRRIAGMATFVDVVFSVALFYIFAGTLAGMAIAIFAGLFMALTLTCIQRVAGCERPGWKRTRWFKGFAHPTWKAV